MTREGAGLAQSGQWLCDAVTGTGADAPCPPGTETLIGPLWASIFADGLLVLVAILIGILVARRPDRQTILVGLAVLAVAFFVVPTRVHERYMFPFFAVAAILAAVSWRWLVAYLVLAAAAFANMYVVLTTIYPNNPQIHDWLGIGRALSSFPGVATIAAVHTVGLGWGLLQWRRASREALEDEIADAADPVPRRRSRAPCALRRRWRRPPTWPAPGCRPRCPHRRPSAPSPSARQRPPSPEPYPVVHPRSRRTWTVALSRAPPRPPDATSQRLWTAPTRTRRRAGRRSSTR